MRQPHRSATKRIGHPSVLTGTHAAASATMLAATPPDKIEGSEGSQWVPWAAQRALLTVARLCGLQSGIDFPRGDVRGKRRHKD